MSKLRNPKKLGYSCHEGGAVHLAPAPRDPRLLPLPELPGVRPPGARVAPPLLRGRQGELWLVKWSQYSPLIGPGLPPPLLHPRPLQPAAAPHRPRVAARGLHHAAGQKIFYNWKNILLCHPAGDGARDSGHGEPRDDHHAGAGRLLAGLQTHHQVIS